MEPYPLIDSRQKSLYEAFLRSHGSGLTQTWEWGEFQASLGGRGKFWVVGVTDGQKAKEVELLGTVLLVKQQLPFGLCWLSVARGPVLGGEDRRQKIEGREVQESGSEKQIKLIWRALWVEILKLAKKERAVFVRVELPCGSPLKLDKAGGWRAAHAHYYPEWTREVDLKPSPEEILAQMKSKGRYNIKVAQKNGVAVRATHRPEDVTAFYAILKETGGRDGFGIHSESYYQALVRAGHEGGWGKLYVAENVECRMKNGEREQGTEAQKRSALIAGIYVTFYGSTATYYYGASAQQYRAMMAPYLLQWEAIQEAKRRGCEWYDFLGVAPPKEKTEDRSQKLGGHPWAGITAFKEKFGGILVKYPPAMEFVVKKGWYWGILFLKKVREIF